MFDKKQTQPYPDRRLTREAVDTILPHDSEFTAFTIDYFPNIHCQFSGSMSRTERLNLLIKYSPLEEIWQKLLEYNPEKSALYLEPFSRAKQATTSAFKIPHIARKNRLPLLAIGALLATTLVGWPSMDNSLGTIYNGSIVVEVRSDPAGTLVFDAKSGDYLGQTPWQSTMRTGTVRKLCLQSFGYCSQLLQIIANSSLKQVSLRRRSRSVDSQPECTEECYVPLSILP